MKQARLAVCGLALTILVALHSSADAQQDAHAGKSASVAVACGCDKQDDIDLESRIKQVEGAIKEYEALIKEWEAKEKSAKEPLLLTHENRGSVQGSVGFRMSGVRLPNARSFGADTDPTCTITIDPSATPCLRGALQDHEAVHKKACDANKSVNPFVDWRQKERLVDYMKEEQAGYRKELERLRNEVDKRKKFCSLDPSTQSELRHTAAEQDRQKDAWERLGLIAQ